MISVVAPRKVLSFIVPLIEIEQLNPNSCCRQSVLPVAELGDRDLIPQLSPIVSGRARYTHSIFRAGRSGPDSESMSASAKAGTAATPSLL